MNLAVVFSFRSQIVLKVRDEHVIDFFQRNIRNIIFRLHKFFHPAVTTVILREGGRGLADTDQFPCVIVVFFEQFQQRPLFRRYPNVLPRKALRTFSTVTNDS